MALGGGGTGGGSSGIKAGAAYVTLGVKDFLSRDLANAQRAFQNFGRNISSIGLKFAGLGAAGVAGLLPISNTLSDLAKQGSIANALGLTSEQFTGIAGVAKSVGNDTKEFIESLVTLGKLGTDAAAGTEQASQAFAAMGLNANEFIKLRADEQFFQVFDALNKMQDPLQRTRALMLAFGEDGGKILLPLLGKSGDELRRMAKGFAISSDDMREATKATTAYNAATQTLSKAWQAVSIAAAPIVKILADGLSAAVAPVTEFVKQNREMVVGLSLAVGGVAALGVGMVAVGTAVSALGASWAAFTGIVSGGMAVLGAIKAVLLTPILAIPAALAAAGAYFASTSATVQSTLGAVFGRLKESWSGIVGAMTRGDFQLAFEIAIATVKVEWGKMVSFFDESWTAFKNAFTLDNIKQVFKDALEFIRDQFNATFDAIRAGDYTGAFGFGGGETGRLEDLAAGRARGAAATLGDFPDTETPDEKRLRQLLITNKFRQAFAAMRGTSLEMAGGGALAAQLNGIALASRGTFGGNVNAGLFGGSGGVGEQIKKGIDKTNELLDKQLDKMTGNVAMPGGGLLFVGGK